MNVRAKFRVGSITDHDGGNKTIKMHPVYSSDPNHENKVFTDYTPGGSIELLIATGKPAGDAFVAGEEYYVDFTPANQQAVDTAPHACLNGADCCGGDQTKTTTETA